MSTGAETAHIPPAAPTETGAIANKLVVLGGGFGLDSLGSPLLSHWATQRLDRVVEHYNDNEARFLEDKGVIVCTGWQTPTWIDTVTPGHMREADEAAAYLESQGVPPNIIKRERTSTNTLHNIAYTFLEGLIDITDISPEDPIGFVSHPHHLKRVLMFAVKMGVPAELIQSIPTTKSDDQFREFVSRMGWQAILTGVEGPERVLRRYERVARRAGGAIAKSRMAIAKIKF